ncbi:hypothetical protein D5S17_04595 [Pseudonocardiaceae bacterium YIM PH 21723]|nr:hypothetical protein D5S17_04595 [Pseudonocardiaceae bacterium YIM PH 21723]
MGNDGSPGSPEPPGSPGGAPGSPGAPGTGGPPPPPVSSFMMSSDRTSFGPSQANISDSGSDVGLASAFTMPRAS